MKTYSVTYETYGNGSGKRVERTEVEAGSKKLAAVRALHAISKAQGENKRYARLISVEPIIREE